MAPAIQMPQDGSSQRNVAAASSVSQGVVSRLLNRFQPTGGYLRLPARGRRHFTIIARQDRYIRQMPHSSAQRLPTGDRLSGVRISDQIVRKRLHEENLRSSCRRAVRGQVHTGQHRTAPPLNLPRITRIGNCATGVLNSSQTSPAFMYPRVTDV